MSDKASKADLAALQRAKVERWLVLQGLHLSAVESEYLAWCKQVSKPCIRIHLGEERVSISLDVPGFAQDWDEKGYQAMRIFDEAHGIDRTMSYQISKSMFFDLPCDHALDRAGGLACELYKIASAFINRELCKGQRITGAVAWEINFPSNAVQVSQIPWATKGPFEEHLKMIPGDKLYRCVVTFENGERFVRTFQAGNEPTFSFLSLHFITDGDHWTRLEKPRSGTDV